MATLRIPCSKPYDVLVADGLLDRVGVLVREDLPRARRALVVTDSTVGPLYAERTLASLRAAGLDAAVFAFPAGEPSKTERTLFDILGTCATANLTRTDLIVALGGGVVGDVAGLAAALWLRGIACVQIPTTLLAAVDSSVGGKTAIDIDAGKNLVGAFHQPSLVVCDPTLLATLPADVFADGCAEVIKYAFIGAAELRAFLETHDVRDDLARVIALCVARKRDAVAADEHDTGERQLLNLGHTIGHAIEMASGFAVSHGRAVAIGMVAAAEGAAACGYAEESAAPAMRAMLRRANLPVRTDFAPETLLPYIAHDKKRAGDRLTFVLPVRGGESELRALDQTEARKFVTRGVLAQ